MACIAPTLRRWPDSGVLISNTIFLAIPVEPFTKEMGQLAAKIDADAKPTRLVIPFEDLLIGVTALHFGYGVATRNLRHFRMIPNLDVIAL